MGAWLGGQKIAKPYLGGVRHNAYLAGQRIWSNPSTPTSSVPIFLPFNGNGNNYGTGGVSATINAGARFATDGVWGTKPVTIDLPFTITSTNQWTVGFWWNGQGVPNTVVLGTDLRSVSASNSVFEAYVWSNTGNSIGWMTITNGTQYYNVPGTGKGFPMFIALRSDNVGFCSKTTSANVVKVQIPVYGSASNKTATAVYVHPYRDTQGDNSAMGRVANMFITNRVMQDEEILAMHALGNMPLSMAA